jgi:hypothetical protein
LVVSQIVFEVVEVISYIGDKGEVIEVKTGANGAAYEGIVADRFSGLPNSRRDDRHMLTGIAAELIASELVLVGIVGNEFEGLATIEMPNLIGFDDMPTADLSGGKQVVNGGKGRSGAAWRIEENRRSVEFAIPAPFGVGLELEPIDKGLDLWRWGDHGARYLAHGEVIILTHKWRMVGENYIVVGDALFYEFIGDADFSAIILDPNLISL